MRKQIQILILLLIVAPLFSFTRAQDINLTGYTLTFDEEFDSLSVTTNSPKGASTWYYLPPYGAAGYYSASIWDASAFSVSNGILSNKAWLDASNNWHSGNISSVDTTGAGFSQQYGYFEARIQMPNSGDGAWPAFWLCTVNTITPGQSGEEIDIFEWYGICNTPGSPSSFIQEASHNWNPDGTQNTSLPYLYSPQTNMPGGAYPWQGYHIYGCLIDPTHITWYIDGVQTNQIATPSSYITSPFYIMIDYALGGGWPLDGMVNNSSLNVDWVRVYSLPSGGGGGSAPSAPSSLTATAGNAQVNLSWTASSGATSYNVYRGTSAGGESTTAIATGVSSTSYSNTGLTNGTAYYYKVAAVNTSGTSGASNEASATPTAGTNTNSSQITWSTAQNMIGNTDISTTGNFFDAVTFHAANVAVNGVTFTTLGSTNTDGTISITAPNGSGPYTTAFTTNSPSSAAYSQLTDTLGFGYYNNGTVTISGLTTGHTYQVQAWSYWTGASAGENTTFTGVTPVTLNTLVGQYAIGTFTAASATLTFNYSATGHCIINAVSVRDIASGGGSALAAPSGLAATAGNAQIALSWTASSGATSYNVYRGTSAGGESTTAIATGISSTTYTDSSLTNGTAYYYKIAAVNSYGTSTYSNEASATPAAGGSNQIANGTYKIVAQSSALAMAANGVTNGSGVSQQTYTGATTQQWNLNNLGNNIVTLIVPGTSESLEVPGGSTVQGANLDVSAYTGATYQQWTPVSVGGGYYEVVNVNSGQEVNVAYNSMTSGGVLCQYGAGNYANGVWSFTSTGGSAPAAPSGLAATVGNAQLSLSWTASSGATSYNVYRGTTAGGESTTAIATGISSTSYTDTGLTNGTTYYYKVAAVNTSGTSGYSNETSAAPSAGGSYLIANGTYKVQVQSSGLALAANGTTNGSAVTQQTYTAANTQKWTVTNLGSNVVSLYVSGTSEALEAPGGTTTNGAMLDVSSYTGATSQQWTIVAVGGGYYEVVNVNSGLEVNVAYGSTSPGGQICQYSTGNYANGVWTFLVP